MTKPRYKHDCENCIFIGHRNENDIYLCMTSDGVDFVARYGNEGGKNYSTFLYNREWLLNILGIMDRNSGITNGNEGE